MPPTGVSPVEVCAGWRLRLVAVAPAGARREREHEDDRDEPEATRGSPEHADLLRSKAYGRGRRRDASQKSLRGGFFTSASVSCPNLPASCCQSTMRRYRDGLMPVWLRKVVMKCDRELNPER